MNRGLVSSILLTFVMLLLVNRAQAVDANRTGSADLNMTESNISLAGAGANKRVPIEVEVGQTLFGIKGADNLGTMDVPDNAVPLTGGCVDANRVVSSDAEDYFATFVPTNDGRYLFALYGRLKVGIDPKNLPSVGELIDLSTWPFLQLELGSNKLFTFVTPEDLSLVSTPIAILLDAIWSNSTCEILARADVAEEGSLFRCIRNVPVPGASAEALMEAFKESPWHLIVSGANFVCPSPVDASLGQYVTAAMADEDADKVPDPIDNCPKTKNFSQEDSDLDGVGDACQAAKECEEKLAELGETKEIEIDSEAATAPESGEGGLPVSLPAPEIEVTGSGHCSLMAAAPVEPSGIFAVIAGLAGLIAVRRRR